MKVHNITPIYKTPVQRLQSERSGYKPLKTQESPSFEKLKKTQLSGLALACACIFKAPLERFDYQGELDYWAYEKVLGLKEWISNSGNLDKELAPWRDYISKSECFAENKTYVALIVLSSLVQRVKKRQPVPRVEPQVVKQTLGEITDELGKDKKFTFNFVKRYQANLVNHVINLNDADEIKNGTGWIMIPSMHHDSAGYVNNMRVLEQLSYRTWCTATPNTGGKLLEEGDFHIYFENKVPRAAIRLRNGYIQEIQGVRNNHHVPIDYIDIIEKRIEDKKLEPTSYVKLEILRAKASKLRADKIRADLADAIKNNDVMTILNYFHFKCEKESWFSFLARKVVAKYKGEDVKERLFVIDDYAQPEAGISFAELGINENKLLAKIKKIRKTANFMCSEATSLGALEEIGGNAYFRGARFKDFGKLRKIGEVIDIRDCKGLQISPDRNLYVKGYKIPPNTDILTLSQNFIINR